MNSNHFRVCNQKPFAATSQEVFALAPGGRTTTMSVKFGRAMQKERTRRSGRMTDSPKEAVDLIVHGLPPAVKAHLKPMPVKS